MKTSNLISIILAITIILVLVFATIFRVVDEHQNKLILVTEKRIVEAAEKCVLEEKCEQKITLNFLIENGYLNRQVHPITKEYIDGNLEISCENEICKTDIN